MKVAYLHVQHGTRVHMKATYGTAGTQPGVYVPGDNGTSAALTVAVWGSWVAFTPDVSLMPQP